jgi:fatty acid desaturase
VFFSLALPLTVAEVLPNLDYAAFARDLDALRTEAVASLCHEDFLHLRMLERWGHWCTTAGYATAWMFPNPVSATLIALGCTARWTTVTHHISHGGMDKVPGVPERYTSRGFAKGRRRMVDWFDWMHPDAWHYEHNVLHHYHTNETLDPDLVEQNVSAMHHPSVPSVVRYAGAAWYALTWKFSYYAPNTFQVLSRAQRSKAEGKPISIDGIANPDPLWWAFDLRRPDGRRFWRTCLLPYGALRFVVFPALYAPLGPFAVANVWLNSVGAELITNLHSFLIIAPNHAGNDVHRYNRGVTDRAEFYVRQVLGSVNFSTGGNVRDFFHGFLNYQIEHHLWPDLPPRVYQKLQPKVRAVCEKHGVPYVQQPLFQRVRKLVDVLVGKAAMQKSATLSRAQRRVEKHASAEPGEAGTLRPL